jgi:excisionase family DNA binding protein
MLDKQAIIRDYQNGASLVGLAYKYGVSHESIKNLLKQSKVKIRKQGQASLYATKTRGPRITEEEAEQIIEMLDKGFSISKITALLQRSRAAVLKKISEYQDQHQPASGAADHNGKINMNNLYKIRKITKDEFYQIKDLIRDGYRSQDIFDKFGSVTKGVLWSIRHAGTYEDFNRRHPKISYSSKQEKVKTETATVTSYSAYEPVDEAKFLKIKDAIARRVNYTDIVQKLEVSKRAITVTRHAKDFEDARRMSPKLFKREPDFIIQAPIPAPLKPVGRVDKEAPPPNNPYVSSKKLRSEKFANAVWFLRKLAIQEGRHDELNKLTFFDIIDNLVDQWADDIAAKYGIDNFETPEKELVKKYNSTVMSMRRRGYLDARAENFGGESKPPAKATGEVKPYMTIEESAEYLGIWPSFVQSLVDENEIKFAKNPQTGEVKIAKRDLDAYAHVDEDGI